VPSLESKLLGYLFAKVSELGFEGIIAKQANAVYKAGRRPGWIKMKNPNYSRRDALRFGDELQGVPSALTTKSAGAR